MQRVAGVNSKNYMDRSTGTCAFIADCNRLLARCVTQASKGAAVEIREAIEIVLGLLRYIDDDEIFFADEVGSWQVGVDWAEVLPALFLCLSRTTEPQEYVRRVVAAVDEFDKYNRVKQLAAARRLATPLQRGAMQGEPASPRDLKVERPGRRSTRPPPRPLPSPGRRMAFRQLGG